MQIIHGTNEHNNFISGGITQSEFLKKMRQTVDKKTEKFTFSKVLNLDNSVPWPENFYRPKL